MKKEMDLDALELELRAQPASRAQEIALALIAGMTSRGEFRCTKFPPYLVGRAVIVQVRTGLPRSAP